MTRWSPDTCGCVVEYAWDPNQAEDVRVHGFHNVVSACPAHVALPPAGVFATVMRENQGKNRMLQAAIEAIPRIRATSGERLVDGVEYLWSFTGAGENRQLVVDFRGVNLTPVEKGQLRSFAAQQLAAQPVTVK